MKWLSILVCCSILTTVGGCSKNETADAHINKANTFINEKKIAEGIIELKNAIKKAPKNKEARFLLGKLYLQQGSGFEAIKELEKAQNLKYTSGKVIPLLARAYSIVKSDEDVIALNEQALKLPDEVKSQYLAYNTLANIRTQDSVSAKKSELLSNQLATITTYSYLASAYILLSENALEAAKVKVKLSLELSPENPDSVMLLGQINTALGLHNKASENYLKYAELQPKSSMIVLLLADSALKDKNYDNAEKYADVILRKIPKQPFANYIKSVARFEAQDYKEASMYAEQAELFGFNSPQLKLVAGASSYFLENFEQSYHHLNSVIKYLPAEHPGKKMFAISQLQLGLIGDITDTLNDFTVTNKQDEKFLSSLSIQLAGIGAIEDAKLLAEKVTSKQSDNAEENIRTGILKLMLNDPSGITNLQNALTLKPDMLSAELALVSAAIQVNDFDKALEISKKWQEKYPEKPAAFNVLATIYLKQGKLDLAKINLNKSLKILPVNHFAISNLMKIALIKNERAEANRLSELGVRLFPEDEKMLKQYYVVARVDVEKKAVATSKIKALFESKSENLKLGLLYAEVLIDQKNYKKALSILDSFKTSIRSPNKLWQLKVIAHRNLNEGTRLFTVIEQWAKTNPYTLEPVLLLVDQHIRKREADSALRVIDRALRGYQKNNVILKVTKMKILLDSGKLQEAKDFYPEFSANKMNEKVLRGFDGRIFLLEKNYKEAVPLLKSLYENVPSSQNIILLAIALKGAQKDKEAITSLEVFLEKNTSDTKISSLLANYYLEKHPIKAIPLYENMLLTKPDNVVFLNNLAWLNLDKGNLELALKYSAKALKLAPEYPNVIDTRGMVLLRAGRKVDAWKTIIKAYNITKGKNPSISLNYVEVLIANDKNEEAIKVLRNIQSENIEIIKRKKQLSKLINSQA
ncbi:MAG: PEP-CTERM system TPR-repeat protein PrsT [Colwellia sp.]|nr:PEP-CTERM system TPR-repeat protein PrsT [Colwellia sp.]